ncbi:MAG: hypothetical protein LKI39_06740 [Bacteroides sp.]|jgi:tRNA A-37 threonylcarbamoyl transferase component Bud32|nr:hypothetical protein [Bacteroides sp.]MCI1682240.1 hypothetical protein [Bacteroides sp.]
MKTRISPEYQDNREIRQLMVELPRLFSQESNIIYKGRNVIKSFTLISDSYVQHKIVIKRYKSPIWIQRIIYSFFRQSKAKRAYYNGITIAQRDVNTPCGIGYAEQWEKGLFKYGYYITEYTADHAIKEKLINPEHFDKIMACDFAKFVASLHKKGILHHDLNSTNVLFSNINGHFQFSLIDINRMKINPQNQHLSKSECLHNLTRFTGRMDLFKFVIQEYAACREWAIEKTLNEAIRIKKQHDKRWHRRKAFLSIFKKEKKQITS